MAKFIQAFVTACALTLSSSHIQNDPVAESLLFIEAHPTHPRLSLITPRRCEHFSSDGRSPFDNHLRTLCRTKKQIPLFEFMTRTPNHLRTCQKVYPSAELTFYDQKQNSIQNKKRSHQLTIDFCRRNIKFIFLSNNQKKKKIFAKDWGRWIYHLPPTDSVTLKAIQKSGIPSLNHGLQVRKLHSRDKRSHPF